MIEKNQAEFGRGLSPVTVKGVRQWLHAIFGFAVAEKLIEENPVSDTKIPRLPPSSANPLTLDEAWAFVSAECDCWYRDAMVFNLHTGLRPEELMALIRDDVDFAKGKLRVERACKWLRGSCVEFGQTKSITSNRTIELAPEHLQFLREVFQKQDRHIEAVEKSGFSYGEPKILEWLGRERSNWKHHYTDLRLIFPKRSGGVPGDLSPRRSFKAMLRRAGITGERRKVRWYDLRHTHATYLLLMGVPEHEVAARMGHSVEMLRSTYSHILPERQRRASSIFINLVPIKITGQMSLEDVRERVRTSMDSSDEELEGALQYLLGSKIKSLS